MLININIEAKQLCKGDTIFERAVVKNITTPKGKDPVDEDWDDSFALVRDSAGNEFKIHCGQWLIVHSNGAFEIRHELEEPEAKKDEKAPTKKA